jgi:predicted glutamine amidotransferase
MSLTLAVYTSDPNLMRCELSRLAGQVPSLVGAPMGAGWFSEDNVLLQRHGAQAPSHELRDLGPTLQSDALLVHSQTLPLGLSLEENTQPFRFREWLFVQAGRIAGQRFRTEAQDLLPEHLMRGIKGETQAEVCFAFFLAQLRSLGRTHDRQLEAAAAAAALGHTARTVERLSAHRDDVVNLFATNNRVLVAARLGAQPLYYRLMEGAPTCELCGLDEGAESAAAVRAHLRRRSVVVASHVTSPGAWLELPDAAALAVGPAMTVEQLRF